MAVRVVPTAFVKDLPPLHWIFPAYAKKAGLRGRPNSASEAAISSRCRTALFELLRAAARDGFPGDAGEGIALRRKVDARVVAGDAAPPIFLLCPWRLCRSRVSTRSGGASEKKKKTTEVRSMEPPSGCSICWARRRGTSPRERSATRAATASSSGASRPVAARERPFGSRRWA